MNKLQKLNEKMAELGLRITTNVDARHIGRKYAIQNIATNGVGWIGYKTLKEIEKEYNLNGK